MRDIVCFDVETTGLSQKEDFIIQLSMTKIDRNLNKKESKSWYIKPIHVYEIK
jgi:DNA polymerase III alpha subunit (gram-positive type)